jgi:glycosyltransferase involved in cell wall biosynthesis/1-acyl-sn-glycerol-3-phosphate acyltransferase
MVIVFVEDNYINETDGVSISTRRFRDELIKRGHTVRVLGIGLEGQDMYGFKEHYVPVVSEVARIQNMHFAKFDKKIVAKAFEGADLVHLTFPWQMERRCFSLAKKMGIPVTAAFHVQPENVSYNMKIKLLRFVNTFLYFLFRTWLYRKIENIHCPSHFTARELARHKYTARLHVISNGISDRFVPPSAPVPKEPDTIRVLMIGRLAEEKRQDLIIKAVQHSKYKEKIQIHFIGRGPMYGRFHRYGLKLPRPPEFEPSFVPQEKMPEQIYRADIYVHASEAEIEGIACIEAISCGKVPIIADSKASAATQFALDERSLFKNKKYLDLRDKLEYWIEHPEELERMGKEYAKLGEKYNINYSVQKLEKMFKDGIKDHKTRKMIHDDKKLKSYYRRVQRNNPIKELFCRLFYFVIAIPILSILLRCWFGLKIKNRRVLLKIRKSGAVAVCNHIHQMDSPICAVGIPWRKLTYVSRPDNFDMKGAGFFVDALGSVPAPMTPRELQVFIYTLSKKIRRRKIVLFFPEGERINYNENLQSFQRGAFYLAVDARSPVLPIQILPRKPDGLFKSLRKKPCFTLIFGEPLYPDSTLSKNEAINDLKERAEKAMS